MTSKSSGHLLRHFAVVFEGGSLTELGEGQLLERFLADRDEVAFPELIAAWPDGPGRLPALAR